MLKSTGSLREFSSSEVFLAVGGEGKEIMENAWIETSELKNRVFKIDSKVPHNGKEESSSLKSLKDETNPKSCNLHEPITLPLAKLETLNVTDISKENPENPTIYVSSEHFEYVCLHP